MTSFKEDFKDIIDDIQAVISDFKITTEISI